MLDWFPFEYQIDRSALISPSGNVLLHALGESFVDGAQAESFAAQSVDLVQKAQANYTALRVGGRWRILGRRRPASWRYPTLCL